MAYAGDKLRVDRVFILKDVSNCGANVLAHSSEELRSDRTDVRSITSVGVVMRHQHGCRYRGFGQDSSCISKSGGLAGESMHEWRINEMFHYDADQIIKKESKELSRQNPQINQRFHSEINEQIDVESTKGSKTEPMNISKIDEK